MSPSCAARRSARPPRETARLSPHRARWLAENVLPYEPAIRAWLRRRVPVGLEVDDVVQETYAVLAALESVDHIQSPRAYAFQAAQSLVSRFHRRAATVRMESMGDFEDLNLASDSPLADQQVAIQETLQALSEAVAALPPKCGEAFRLRKIVGMSQRDVARTLAISESTVEKHIARGVRFLCAALEARLGPDATSAFAEADIRQFALAKRKSYVKAEE
jgi:RNA polymerase sigma factor (sigma-70 family)